MGESLETKRRVYKPSPLWWPAYDSKKDDSGKEKDNTQRVISGFVMSDRHLIGRPLSEEKIPVLKKPERMDDRAIINHIHNDPHPETGIDYQTTKYSVLVELAAGGDSEADIYKINIDNFIAREKRYCEYAMMGTRADIDHGEPSFFADPDHPIIIPTTKRGFGRRMLIFTVSPKMLFRSAERRFAIESFLNSNYEPEIRPDWMDLIASAYYTVLNDPDIIGEISDLAMYMNGLSDSPQKRRGLIHASVANEIERSLFGGITSNTEEYKYAVHLPEDDEHTEDPRVIVLDDRRYKTPEWLDSLSENDARLLTDDNQNQADRKRKERLKKRLNEFYPIRQSFSDEAHRHGRKKHSTSFFKTSFWDYLKKRIGEAQPPCIPVARIPCDNKGRAIYWEAWHYKFHGLTDIKACEFCDKSRKK